MEIEKTPDAPPASLDDAELEDVSGCAILKPVMGWTCPGCKAMYNEKQSPCPECGYES